MNAPPDSDVEQALAQGFLLDGLRVEPQTGEVSGPGGREQLDPKVMDVLLLMARQANRVVSRDELLARLWPGAVVTDDALTRCFYELRRQLSNAGGDERYRGLIETLPKRGYRLHGEIRPLPQPGATPAGRERRRRWPAIVVGLVALALVLAWLARPGDDGSGVAATGHRPSVAVLPFADMSESQDQAYLADGVAEEILNRLAAIGDLRVIARTSSFMFRGEGTDIAEIARRLDVTHVLEGSVRRSGDQLRVTAQLISAADRSHVWSRTYEHRLGDLFRTQDEIAASVAAALAATLAARSPGPERPVDVAAFVELTQGNFLYHRRAEGDIDRAIGHFRRAIEIDPGYARAWAALAGAYGQQAWQGRLRNPELHAKQGEAARRAVELDPGLAVAHARLAQYHDDLQDRARAEELMQKALVLDPDEPLVIGYLVGRAIDGDELAEATRQQQRLVARDPLALAPRITLSLLLMAEERYEDALAELRAVLRISPEIPAEDRAELARILILLRRYDEARREIELLPAGRQRDQCLALLYRAPGHRAEADAALARLEPDPADLIHNLRLAEAHALRGARDEAFAVLLAQRAAMERAAQAGGLHRLWQLQVEVRLSPFLKPLHHDPRWAQLMAREGR